MSEICEKCKPIVEKLFRDLEIRFEKRIEDLERKNKELERRLAAYENAHTPYSRKIFKPKPKATNGKRGRPEGYQGTTRPFPEPDRTVEKKFCRCPTCNGKLKLKFRESTIVEDIPEPQPIIVTEFITNHYECKICGDVVAKHEDCPESGRFGNNVLAHCSLMKFEDRLTFRKLHESLKRHYNLEITPASIMNITRNVYRKLEPEHEELINTIRASPCVYADETSLRINGTKHWIWIFVANDAVLCVIRKSRGKKVVKEILGDYRGIVICDGWRSYAGFDFIIQRCWAHLLREADELKSRKIYDYLHTLFADAKSGSLTRNVAEERLRKLICRRYKNQKCMKLLNKIKNGFHSWFTFLEHNVEPTNNIAERALREHVVIRKIIGGLRSLKGARVHEVLMSCFATWKMQGLNLFCTLTNCLRS